MKKNEYKYFCIYCLLFEITFTVAILAQEKSGSACRLPRSITVLCQRSSSSSRKRYLQQLSQDRALPIAR